MPERFIGRTHSSYEAAQENYVATSDGWQVSPEFVGGKMRRNVKRVIRARSALNAILEEPDSKKRHSRANRKLFAPSQLDPGGHVNMSPDPTDVERLLAEQEPKPTQVQPEPSVDIRYKVSTGLVSLSSPVEVFDFVLDEEFHEELSSDSA